MANFNKSKTSSYSYATSWCFFSFTAFWLVKFWNYRQLSCSAAYRQWTTCVITKKKSSKLEQFFFEIVRQGDNFYLMHFWNNDVAQKMLENEGFEKKFSWKWTKLPKIFTVKLDINIFWSFWYINYFQRWNFCLGWAESFYFSSKVWTLFFLWLSYHGWLQFKKRIYWLRLWTFIVQ